MDVPDFILFGFTSLVFDLLYCLGYPVGRITTSAEFHPSSLKSTGVYGSGLYCASHYQDNDAYLHVDTNQQTNGQVTDRIPPIVEGWIFVGIFSFVFILGFICLLWKILKECCTPEKEPVLCWTPNFGKQLQKMQESIGLNRINRASVHPRLDISLLRLIEYVRAGKAVPKAIPGAILNDIRKLDRTFNGNEQQDSFQFFNTVISGLEALSKEMMSNGQECQKDETELERLMNTSPISRLFGGVFVTVYTYTNCDHVETVFQRFTGIPVDIPVANATIKKNIYRLYGVVCHSGSITSGHYTSYVRTTCHQEEEFEKRFLTQRWSDPESPLDKIQDNHLAECGQNTTQSYQHSDTQGKSAAGVKKEASPNTENGIWYYISDSSVSKCKKESALCAPTAYLLMYERF